MSETGNVFTQGPDGRWSPSIPEPFWFRRWFRWIPGCYECSMTSRREVRFRNRSEYELHYRDHHLGGS